MGKGSHYCGSLKIPLITWGRGWQNVGLEPLNCATYNPDKMADLGGILAGRWNRTLSQGSVCSQPKQCTIKSKSLKVSIHLHCWIPHYAGSANLYRRILMCDKLTDKLNPLMFLIWDAVGGRSHLLARSLEHLGLILWHVPCIAENYWAAEQTKQFHCAICSHMESWLGLEVHCIVCI